MSALTDKIDTLFQSWDQPDTPGCAVLITQDGQEVYARGYGMANLEYAIPITPTSIFHVASISKQFTAMAILLLAHEGKIALDADIRVYIPELPDYGQPITIHHLMHHTSGLRDQWDLLELAGWREHDVKTNGDVLALVRRQHALNFQPGTEYSYSNTGYTLMALIVERVSGKSLRTYCDETIFQPLAMTQTHFHDDHSMIVKNRAYAYTPAPAGGYQISIPTFDTVGATSLFTSVGDLARWHENFYHQRVGGSTVVEQMVTNGRLNNGEQLSYAGGLRIKEYRGLKTMGHGGLDAGYRAHQLCFPAQHMAVIILGNLSSLDPATLAKRVADILLEGQFKPANAPEQQMSKDFANFAGTYRHATTGALRKLSWQDNTLKVSPGPGSELEQVGELLCKVVDTVYEFVFERTEDGTHLLHEYAPQGQTNSYTRIPTIQLTPTQLAEYTGTYYSEEVLNTVTLTLQDETLVAYTLKAGPMPLSLSSADGIVKNGLQIVFSRDEQQQIAGYTLSQPRTRNVYFRKQDSRM